MAFTVLSEKGQVVIPKIIRDTLNINIADKFEVSISEENTILMKPVLNTSDVFGMFKTKKHITKRDIKEAKETHIQQKFN